MKRKLLMAGAILAAAVMVLPAGRNYLGFLLNSDPIDHTNHGWEVRRNNNHKQPEIPSNAMEMLKKYNGIYVGDPDRKVIYLTIDLGYESGNTGAILDTLKKNDVKATFFIISSYLKKNPDVVDRIVKEGHSLQNHTLNYRHLNALSEYQIRREIMDMHSVIKEQYGISMKYLRLPYEDWSQKVMNVANGCGYKTVFWSTACVDWVEETDSSYIYDSIMRNYHNGAVILMHAVSKGSPEAVGMIIRDLKDKEYEFRVLDM